MIYFTRQERTVLIFLGVVLFIGTILDYAFKKNPQLTDFVNAIDNYPIYHKVDLNKATYYELTRLPHIGAKTAKRIIAYRNKHGVFSNVKQIRQIQGISQARYLKIKKFFKINLRKNSL